MKDPYKEYREYNEKHGKMDYRDTDHKYRVAAGFVWLGMIGILITLIIWMI